MRFARSLRRGLVLHAEQITYEDCAGDDVVCDFCGNRVYKCVRETGSEQIHYLSHYQAQSEEARACEERHASQHGESTASTSISRGQNLSDRVEAINRILLASHPANSQLASEVAAACVSSDSFAGLLPASTPLGMLRASSTRAFRLFASYRGHQTDVPLGDQAHDVPDLLRRLTRAMEAIPSDGRHLSWSRWTGELLSLIVLAESAPALDLLFAHSVASIINDHAETTPTIAQSLIEMAVLDVGEPEMDPGELRAFIVRVMLLNLGSVDPAMPVPPVRAAEVGPLTSAPVGIGRRIHHDGSRRRSA